MREDSSSASATDALGSVRLTLDDNGTAYSGATYDPWGSPERGSVGTFGFTGELQQGDNVYLRARWYNANNGTFTSKDPFEGYSQQPYSLHPYQYGYSAPTVFTDPSGRCVPEWVPLIGENGCTLSAGIGQGQLDVDGFQEYSADVVQGMGLPGAMVYDAIYDTNHTQRIVSEGGIGVALGSAFTVAATAAIPSLAAGIGTGTSAVATSLAARTAAYSMGSAYYNAYRPNHPGLMIPGYILGYENIYRDLGTMWDCNAPWSQRGYAVGDAALNMVLGITMLSGVKSSVQSFHTAMQLRGLSAAERLTVLQSIASREAQALLETTTGIPYRPLGQRVIQLQEQSLSGNAWRLSGNFYHELAHVTQEFGALGGINKVLQQASVITGNIPGSLLYIINPVEVHAFASGLSAPLNIAGVGIGRLEAHCLSTGSSSDSICVMAGNNLHRLYSHYFGQ